MGWPDSELAKASFPDERLEKRFRLLLSQLASSPGGPIPFAWQDWANTKVAYRVLDAGRVGKAEILSEHFEATRGRCAAADGPILVLHDATECTFKRADAHTVGVTRKAVAGAYRDVRCGTTPLAALACTRAAGNDNGTATRSHSKQSRYPQLELTILRATDRLEGDH